MRTAIIAMALLLLSAADESPPPSTVEAERILDEIDAIYTRAKDAGTIRIGGADGDPTILLMNLPQRTAALREQLHALATASKRWDRETPILLAWYEAHSLKAILPLVSGAKAYCNPTQPVSGEELCDAIEREPRRALHEAIKSLPGALPPMPRNISASPTQPMELRGAIKQAILYFEQAAHSDNQEKQDGGSFMPQLSDEVRNRDLNWIRTRLYELAARAEFLRSTQEIKQLLTDASDRVQLSPALHPQDKSWIGLHLRFVESLVEHWRVWSQC